MAERKVGLMEAAATGAAPPAFGDKTKAFDDSDYEGEGEDEEADEGELVRLWEAVIEGDQGIIEELLVGDEEHPPLPVSVNVQDEHGLTPLHHLTIEGHAGVAQWLLEEVKANIDERDGKTGQTPLQMAAAKGKATMAALLMQRGANVVARDAAGWTPLHAAARSGFCDVAAELLTALSAEQINAAGPLGHTPLHRAAYWGNAEVCALLLKHGAEKSLLDEAQRSAADLVCAGGERCNMLPTLVKLLRPPPLPR